MRTLIAILFLGIGSISYGQLEKKFIEKGYSNYQEGEFEQASENFLDALDIDPGNYEATYNYGDALFRIEKFEEAGIQFEQIVEKAPDKTRKAECYHNLGNCLLQEGKLEDCIDAYKNSLRNNPTDHETRYNLAFAQKLLKEQQNQDQKQDQQENKEQQENQDNQDKNQEKQDKKQENQDQKDKEDQQQQNKEGQKDEEQDQQPQQGEKQKISKEDAERILQSLMRQEKNTQEKLKKKEQKKVEKVKIEKDW